MANMLNLPNAEEDKPILADVQEPQLENSIFQRGDLKSTGDGMVALAQGLAAYGSAQTNREISSIKNSASIGEAAMGGLAQMAGKLKQNFKEQGGEDQIAYQVDPESGRMSAVGPGQPFSGANDMFSGGSIGDDLLGGFFKSSSGSGNYTAPTTEEAGQRPANIGERKPGQVTGPGTVAQATIVAGPAQHLQNLQNDLQDIANENASNPSGYLKASNEYLAKQYELSTSLGKGGIKAFEHATNFAGQLYRGISSKYTAQKLRGDYNDTLARNDSLTNDLYSTSRTYDDSKQSFDDWFSNSPQWKELNNNVAGISTNPALNSDFGQQKAANYLEAVKDTARQEYVIGKAASIRDEKGYDAAYEWLKNETIENKNSSLSPEKKTTAWRAGVAEINALNETQKAERSAAASATQKMMTDLRNGGFKIIPHQDILNMAAAARKAHYPEGALALESLARINNSRDVQTAFQLPAVKAVETLFGPGGKSIVTSTAKSNIMDTAHKNGMMNYNEFKDKLILEKGATPQERNLYDDHLENLWGNGGIDNPDGSRSTIEQAIVQNPVDGKFYNVPTIWNGKRHTETEALNRAYAKGIERYPSSDDPKALDERYLKDIHPYFDQDVQRYRGEKQSRPYMFPDQTGGFGSYKSGDIPLSGSAAHYGESYVVGGMKPEFRDRVAAMMRAAKAEGVPLSIHSGFRSQEHQDRLFAQSDGSGHWVAKHSHHTNGDAADLSGDLNWAQRNAQRFGLHFPMSWEKWHVELEGSRGQQQYSYSQGPVSNRSVANAIFGQESGWNPNARTSVNGAHGIAQITQGTFNQFAQPGENISNPEHNARVGQRIIDHYMKKYNGDVSRVAVAYFSGEGNVAPMGYAQPYKEDKKDGNGKSVSGYVTDVMGRLYQDRSGYGANQGSYMPSGPSGPSPMTEPMNTTYAGPSSAIPFTVDEMAHNMYLGSDFVRDKVNDLNTEAGTLKGLLPGIEDNLRKGIAPDQEMVASVMQFAKAYPEKLPGVFEKLSAISEASQNVWKLNGKDLNQWLDQTYEMAKTSPDLRTQILAKEAKAQSEAALKLQNDDPWEYGYRSGVSKSKPINWAEATNPQQFGAQNAGQVIGTAMDQRKQFGAALKEKIGTGSLMEYVYPKKDLDALADTLDNADGLQVSEILGGIQANVSSPQEMARILSNKNVVKSLFGLSKSDDINRALPANKFLDYAHDMGPVVFSGNFGEKSVNDIKAFMYNARYNSGKTAVELQNSQRELNTSDPVYRAKEREAAKAALDFTPTKVMSYLKDNKAIESMSNDSFFHNVAKDSPVSPDKFSKESGENAMVDLFRKRYISAYANNATDKGAKEIAAAYVGDSFKRSSFNGGRLLWNSPENVYGEHPEMLQPFTQGLNKFVFDNAMKQNIRLDNNAIFTPQMAAGSSGTFGFGAKPGAYLLSDKQTANERIDMKNPTYMIQVKDVDGKWHLLLDQNKKPLRYGLPNESAQQQMPVPNLGQ